jgi:hypothetical protein
VVILERIGVLRNYLFMIREFGKNSKLVKIRNEFHYLVLRYLELIFIQQYEYVWYMFNFKAVEASIANFHRLGIEVTDKFVNKANTVVIQCKDFQNFEPEVLPNLVISNLPYGERLGSVEELKPVYKELGLLLRNKMQRPGKAFFLLKDSELLKEMRLQRSRKIVLNNGGLSTYLVTYDVLESSNNKT